MTSSFPSETLVRSISLHCWFISKLRGLTRASQCRVRAIGSLGKVSLMLPTDPHVRIEQTIRNVRRRGDVYFASGDLLRKDSFGFYFWVDRIGDTFRRATSQSDNESLCAESQIRERPFADAGSLSRYIFPPSSHEVSLLSTFHTAGSKDPLQHALESLSPIKAPQVIPDQCERSCVVAVEPVYFSVYFFACAMGDKSIVVLTITP